MGGHHQHEARGSSTRSGSWEGYEALRKALDGLATAKGVSQSRIGAVAKLAAQNAKSYKHVVHDIEVFLWKAEVEHRLAGLYAIDAIIRQSHAKNDPKDMYVKRFFIRLADTIAAVKKVPEQSQSRVRHVIEEWQKRGIYTAAQLEAAGGRAYIWSEADSAEAQTPDRQTGNVTPRTSPGKLASLLSILKKKKEEHEYAPQPSEQRQQPPYEATYDNKQGRQGDDAYTHERRSYEERPTDEQQYGRREVGGIMGDAPGVPVGSGRIRRAPEEAENSRGTKKPRGSRWGPPKMANAPQSERPAPIITSLDRASEFASDRSAYVSPAGRPESSRQPPLLQSPPRGVAPRSDEWNRGLNRPTSGSHAAAAAGSAWPPNESVRSPQSAILSQATPDGRLDYGYARTGRNEAARYEQGGGMQSPYPRNGDRQSPHQQQGPPGDSVPGASGQLCRKFLSGRCTFGDRCWNVHDPQALQSGRPHTEMDEAKRKTVLCNNFPLGTCRYGDKCSFAHGYEDLDNAASRAPMHGDRDGIDDSTGRRWRASPNAQPGGREPSQLAPSVHNATAAVPPQQARPYGAAQAVYNEPQGDRGSSGGGASSMFYANGAAPSPGGRRLPPGQLPTSTTGQQGSQPMYTSAPSGYATQGLSYSSGIDQGPASVKPSPSSQTYPTPPIGGHAAVATGSKVLADDDDGDTAEPEFTLQYDDDD